MSENPVAVTQALDRAERYAKSLLKTQEEHDDIMTAVRLARGNTPAAGLEREAVARLAHPQAFQEYTQRCLSSTDRNFRERAEAEVRRAYEKADAILAPLTKPTPPASVSGSLRGVLPPASDAPPQYLEGWCDAMSYADSIVTAEKPASVSSEVTALREAALEAARDLVMRPGGLRNNGEHLIVVEKADKTDAHYRLCTALEALDALAAAPEAATPSAVGGEELGPLWRKVHRVHSEAMSEGCTGGEYRARMLAALATGETSPDRGAGRG